MRKIFGSVLLLFLLVGCFPAGQVLDSGPWAGCTTSADGTTVDCDWGTPRLHDDRAGRDDVWPSIPPVPVPPDQPSPDPQPEPDPEPDPEPEPPTVCKPGWGYGNPHTCHYGPPTKDGSERIY